MKKYLLLILIVLAVMSLGLRKKTPVETTPPPTQQEETASPAAEPAATPSETPAAMPAETPAATAAPAQSTGQEAAPAQTPEPSTTPAAAPAQPAGQEAAPAVPQAETLQDFTVAASKKKGLIVIKVFSKQFSLIASATLVDAGNHYALEKQSGFLKVEVPITKAMTKAKKYNCKVFVKDQQGRALFKKVEINL